MTITLKTLPDTSPQQLFNHVATHLLRQNDRSLRPPDAKDIGCAYRGFDGLMCAAGCLMSDDEYHASMEGKDWDDLTTHSNVPSVHKRLIWSLQIVHDRDMPNYWPRRLREIASEHALDTAALDRLSSPT